MAASLRCIGADDPGDVAAPMILARSRSEQPSAPTLVQADRARNYDARHERAASPEPSLRPPHDGCITARPWNAVRPDRARLTGHAPSIALPDVGACPPGAYAGTAVRAVDRSLVGG